MFHRLDPETLLLPPSRAPPRLLPPPPPSHSALTEKLSSTSDTNTSERRSASTAPPAGGSSSSSLSRCSSDLSHLLLNIKACRWRHFRPRTLPPHALADAHPLFRRLSRGLRRPGPDGGSLGGPAAPSRPAPPPVVGEYQWTRGSAEPPRYGRLTTAEVGTVVFGGAMLASMCVALG